MTTTDIISKIETSYAIGIEDASIRLKESFAVLDKNILFSISVCSLESVESTTAYFYNTKEYVHYFRLSNIKDLIDLLEQMNAMKHKTTQMLYDIILEKHLEPTEPFYLKIFLFEGIRINKKP